MVCLTSESHDERRKRFIREHEDDLNVLLQALRLISPPKPMNDRSQANDDPEHRRNASSKVKE